MPKPYVSTLDAAGGGGLAPVELTEAARRLLEALEAHDGRPVEVRELVRAGAARSSMSAFCHLLDLERAGLVRAAGKRWQAAGAGTCSTSWEGGGDGEDT